MSGLERGTFGAVWIEAPRVGTIMASDIGLILRSEHRDLLMLAERCGRMVRGFQDPLADLGCRLQAHLTAAQAEVYPVLHPMSAAAPDLADAILRAGGVLGSEDAPRESWEQATGGLVEAERAQLLPMLAKVPIDERRRMGRVFRLQRDSALRGSRARQHRQRSQTELYEQARRVGLERRSTMTQAELQLALALWERRSGYGRDTPGG